MKTFIRIFILITGFFLFTQEIQAQNVVKGIVSDQESDYPMAGAVVSIPGTETSVVTDDNGAFQITLPPGTKQLSISMMGYVKKVMKVTDKTSELLIQLEPSILLLNEVVLENNSSDKKLLQNTSSVGVLTEKDFQRNNNIFLQNSLNTISGVRMNNRSTTSQSNILIRGIGTYSRFSNRGIKMYLNGIPLSDADGTTSMDDIDFTMIGRAEVIKGPASSVYGATLGGVVLLQTIKAPQGTKSINQSVLAGSYGLLRTNTGIMLGTDKTNLLINYGHQQFQGYRNHSNSNKDFVNVAGDFRISSKQNLTVLFNYTKIDDNYAGELDSANIISDPTQAFKMYLIKDVGLTQAQTRLAVGHTYHFSSKFSNTTSVFTGSTNFDSPIEPYYGTGNKNKYGARTVFSYLPTIAGLKTRFHLGSEFIYNDDLNRRYFSNFTTGAVDTIIYDTETKANQLNVFGQAEVDLTKKTTFTLGASYNIVHYKLIDRQKVKGVNYSGDVSFTPVFTPRAAIVHTFNNKIAVFANVSTGFSPPTASQISLVTGAVNKNLKAETNVSYEIGTRGNVIKNKLTYGLSVFSMKMQNLLIPQVQAGFTSYVNAAKTRNNGVELNLSYLLINDTTGFVHLVRPFVAYTYNDFIFKNYVVGTNNYSGNKATGISPNVINAGFDVQLKFGIYLNATYYYYDKMPMMDNNSLFYKAYSLLNTRLGIRGVVFKHFQYDLFGGIENALDTRYSGSIALNTTPRPPQEPTARFYNPALPRNYYGGLSLRYLF